MNTHHPPVTLVRRSLTTLLAALLVLTHILPAAAQPKPGQPAPASPHTPVVRYTGMTTGVVGAPFVLRARVRDAVTGAPLPGAPVIFTLGDLSFAASADATGVAEQVTQLTPALAGASVTARYGGQVAQAGDLLALATTDGGDALSTATVTAAALTPASLVATLTPGQSVVENKLATLPAAAQAAGDIVFAFDTTASMGFSLPATQGLAEDIMAALTADGLDVRFGATAFQDYAGDFPAAFGYPATAYGAAGSYPHVRVQPLSADTTAVANAIYTLQAASSDDPGDPPGSYSRALYETVAELTPAGADPTAGALGYRANARRMVALFGDDLPHDNDLNQGVPNTSGVYSTGGDPGRDGVLQETSNPAAIGVGNDDLDWQGVLATMQSNGVALLSYDLNPFTTDYWSTWAAATGGEHLFDYDGMVAALRRRMQSQSTAASVTLRASAGFESWVSVQPASYTNVALPASLPFSVTITPPPGTAPGLYTFRVELLNGARVEAWQSVAITVPGAANRAPTAVNDSFSVDEDSLDNALAVLANDSDLDGDTLTVTAVTQPANGNVTLVGGVVRYTPNANYNSADSFTYTVSDGALTAAATVALTVRPVNDAPTAVNDSFSVDEDSLDNALAVLANDSDLDGDNLTVTAVTQPANGSVTLVGGVVRYTPNANYNGADSFTYTISDGALTATAAVAITVRPINDAPTAGDDAFQVDRNSADNMLDVLANDSDLDNDSLMLVAVSSPDQGSAVISGAAIRYTPPVGYVGAARFTYTVSDGVLTAMATVEVTVRAFNRTPTATDDQFTVAEDSGASDLAVLTNDSDPDSDPLVIAAVTTPAHGTATIAGDRVRYTPNADFHGADAFTYTVSDGGLSAIARVTVTVTPVNDAPTAVNDSFSVDEDSLDNALAVLANDSDLDGDTLTVTAVTQPANGSVMLVGGVVRYTPNPNYNGADSFTYTVSDSALTATATVAVTVRPVNDAPTAVNDSFSVDEDSLDNALAVLANDSDLDGDNLTVTAVTQPTNGSVMLVAGVVRYTPNPNYRGADSFTYTVSDGALTATATVVITVAGVNRAPLAVNDVFTVTENSANNVLAVRANDSDPDNDALTIVAVGVASNGVASHDGAVVRYTPNPNYRGADSFTYTISDGELTATATVAIHVQPAAGAPGVMLALAIEGSGAAGDGVITVGQTVTVVATITNTGQSALMVVPLRLAVAPAVLEMVGASLTPDNVSGGMHVWDDVTGAGTLAPGARTEVRVIFRSIGPSRDLPGQVMTAAGIVQGATDAAGQTAPPANVVAQVRVTAPQVAIATRMIDPAGGELKANQVLTMSVRITNTGDTLITTLPLRDRFDGAVLTFVRASVSGGKVTGSGAAAQVAWSDLTTALGDLAPGQSVEVLITYRIKVVFWSSVRQSVVEGARDEYGDLLPAATASTTIYCMKLELMMTAQPPAGSRVPRNAEIEYTLRLRTPGVAPLTNLVLRSNVTGDGAFYIEDAMDGAASALDHATTCPVRVGAPSHATQQTWVMDRLDAGASCTIVFKTKVAATRKSGFVEVSVEGMAAELLTPATVKVRHSVTTQLSADIAAFAATRRAAEIDVFWAALVEEDVTGYHVWRSVHNEMSTAERITAQPVAPASGAQGFYTIVDALPDGAEEAYYWLEVIRNDASEFVGPVWIAPQTQTLLYLPITIKASQR